MAKKRLDLKVVPTGPIDGYWITVDGVGVTMDGIAHSGAVLLDSPEHHSIQYFMQGPSGSLAIAGIDAALQVTVVSVNAGIIAGKRYGFGNKDFLL